MKQSEKIQLQIDQYIRENHHKITENDWVIHKLKVKVMREQNVENFESKWLHKFEALFPVEKRPNDSFMVTTRSHGVIDYLPKSNKMLIREKCQWKTGALKWMVQNLLEIK